MHGSKHRKKSQLLIILSMICKSHIEEVRGNMLNPSFRTDSLWTKYPREVDKCRNRIPYINHFILSKYSQHLVQYNKCLERESHHKPAPHHKGIYIQIT